MTNTKITEDNRLPLSYQDLKESLTITELNNNDVQKFLNMFYDKDEVKELIGEFIYNE